MRSPSYALIVGAGRSGSGWFLDLFDLSPQTHCRNEPDGIQTSPLCCLPGGSVADEHSFPALLADWDEAIQWTVARMGERDRPIRIPKNHFRAGRHSPRLARLVLDPKFRRLLGVAYRELRQREWIAPRWLCSSRKLKNALPVLKIAPPGWTVFVLQNKPQTEVFHLVRHPGGFLNSWSNRYLVGRNHNAVSAANKERLHQIAAMDSSWAERFGDIDALCIEESELLYWCYTNEIIANEGQVSDRYHRILYEDLVQETVVCMRHAFAACGLDWTEAIQRCVVAGSKQSHLIASRWREGLSNKQMAIVHRILNASAMKTWWANDLSEEQISAAGQASGAVR